MIIGARYLRGRHASGGFDSLLKLNPFFADYVARATRRTGRTEADAHGGGSGAIYHRPGPVL